MLFIIVLVVLIIVLSNGKTKQKQADKTPDNNVNKSKTTPSTPAAQTGRPQTQSPRPPRTPAVQQPVKPTKSNVSPVEEEKTSTMDYLAEKAENEARSDAANAYRPSGKVAKRMPDWGGPGKGEWVVLCSYCGEENILPRGAAVRGYSCCFCGEKLK